MTPAPRTAPRPVPLMVGLGLTLLECVVLVVVGVGSLVSALRAGSADMGLTVGVLLFLLLLAGLVLLGVRALWHGRRWGRGPVVTWQLLQLAVGAASFGQVPWWASVLPMLVAVVTAVCVLVPSSVEATSARGRPDSLA